MSRSLGERREYGAYKRTLGSAVHYDAGLLKLHLAEPSFRFDGLGSSWLVEMGRYQERSGLYPSPAFIEEMDARANRLEDMRRLLDAVKALREYDPILHWALFSVCIAGECGIARGRKTRHTGTVWDKVLRSSPYGGDDGKLWTHLQAGWSLVAVLAVEGAILAAAQEVGAVDAKAVAWARERGLLERIDGSG